MIDRNPDVDLDTETIPSGMVLVAGKNLMHTARANKLPFGVASRKTPAGNSTRRETMGLVVRDEHREPMLAALAVKNSHKKKEVEP